MQERDPHEIEYVPEPESGLAEFFRRLSSWRPELYQLLAGVAAFISVVSAIFIEGPIGTVCAVFGAGAAVFIGLDGWLAAKRHQEREQAYIAAREALAEAQANYERACADPDCTTYDFADACIELTLAQENFNKAFGLGVAL